jgi:hypothetical protein
MRTFRPPLAPRRAPAVVAPAPRPVRHAARSLTTAGNLSFLVGSVLFLSEASQVAGVWLFIAGSSAFLVAGAIRDRD